MNKELSEVQRFVNRTIAEFNKHDKKRRKQQELVVREYRKQLERVKKQYILIDELEPEIRTLLCREWYNCDLENTYEIFESLYYELIGRLITKNGLDIV